MDDILVSELDCKEKDSTSEECLKYCMGNYIASECSKCETEQDKERYTYCQEDDAIKYCNELNKMLVLNPNEMPLVVDDADDSNAYWPQTRAGITNVKGTCLEGSMERDNMPPRRDCTIDQVWASVCDRCMSRNHRG